VSRTIVPSKLFFFAGVTWKDLLCRGCVSTSAWLMALPEKSCHLTRVRLAGPGRARPGRAGPHAQKGEGLDTQEGVGVPRLVQTRERSLTLTVSLSSPSNSVFILLRKVIRVLMESPNRSFALYSVHRREMKNQPDVFLKMSCLSNFPYGPFVWSLKWNFRLF